LTTVAQHIIAALEYSGVHRVYGLPGDSLNGLTDAIRRSDGIRWEHVHHEEAAALAATAPTWAGTKVLRLRCDRARYTGGTVWWRSALI
jgi:thiamine pyrophosphate-dependent acetolactate synthase large subunit-like protein